MENEKKSLLTIMTGQYLLVIMFALLAVYLLVFGAEYDYKNAIRSLIVLAGSGVLAIISGRWLGFYKDLAKIKFWSKKWNIIVLNIICLFSIFFSTSSSKSGFSIAFSWESEWTRHTFLILVVWAAIYTATFNIVLSLRAKARS